MDFLENPVSVGVLNGLLGSIVAGQEATKYENKNRLKLKLIGTCLLEKKITKMIFLKIFMKLK